MSLKLIAWLYLDFIYLKVIIEEGIHNFYYVYFSSEKGIVSWSSLSANFLFSKKRGFIMKERIQIKHDIAANWEKAKNFIPLAGELVIYDGLIENGIYIEPPRLKIGDGKTKINDLPFIEIKASTESSPKYKVEDDLLELK